MVYFSPGLLFNAGYLFTIFHRNLPHSVFPLPFRCLTLRYTAFAATCLPVGYFFPVVFLRHSLQSSATFGTRTLPGVPPFFRAVPSAVPGLPSLLGQTGHATFWKYARLRTTPHLNFVCSGAESGFPFQTIRLLRRLLRYRRVVIGIGKGVCPMRPNNAISLNLRHIIPVDSRVILRIIIINRTAVAPPLPEKNPAGSISADNVQYVDQSFVVVQGDG